MKKYNLIILAIATLLVFSCNKENDDEGTTTESLLIGVWQPTKLGTICSSNNNNEFIYTACMLTSSTAFNEDASYTDIFNVDVSGGCENSYTLTGTWEVDGEIVKITFNDGQQIEFSILNLTENALKLGLEGGGSDSFCEDGSTVIRNYIEYLRVE